jgi:short-subunit dehydrogenase
MVREAVAAGNSRPRRTLVMRPDARAERAAMATEFRERYGPWAVIAGAAAGLGAEWSHQLAARGLDLVLLDRDEHTLEQTAGAIRAAHPVAVQPVTVDLGRPDLIDALRAPLAGRDVGLLVYNAAIGTVAPFLDLEAEHVDTMIAVNCSAPLHLARTLLPAMVSRGRGGIVLMSSLSGNVGSAQLAVYAASKAFALVAAQALWAEMRPHGVDVLAVQPGSTRTPGWMTSQPADDVGLGLPVMEPADVVREALDTLGVEPVVVPGEMNRQGAETLARLPRREVIELMSAVTGRLVPNYRSPRARS